MSLLQEEFYGSIFLSFFLSFFLFFFLLFRLHTSFFSSFQTQLFQKLNLIPSSGNFLLSWIIHKGLAQHNTTLVTFADDTVILSVNEDSRRAASDLQHHHNSLQTWFEKWRIRRNENKSCSITFTLRKRSTPDVTINDIQIPRKTEIKYLEMNIDSKLTRKQHIAKKRKKSQHHHQTMKLATRQKI
jgi:hypothetical protein